MLTQPWTAAFPMERRPDYQFFEYACHEDNTAVRNYIVTSRYERAHAEEDNENSARPFGRRLRRCSRRVCSRRPRANAALTEPLKLDVGTARRQRRVVAGRSRVQGHSVRGAAGRRAAFAKPSSPCEMGRRARREQVRQHLHPARRRPTRPTASTWRSCPTRRRCRRTVST